MQSRKMTMALAGFLGIGTTMAQADDAPPPRAEFSNAPAGFIPPPLHPQGVNLRSEKVGEGVFAILSDHPAVDNAGFIIGERGVLAIDSHISPAMAQQILSLIRAQTDKPILYLVNTNYHGDHTFGNATFPNDTTIIAHSATAENMRDLRHEKEFMLATVQGDRSVFQDVELRMPDLTFEDELNIDLGGRVVQIHHFGRGNTAGDTIVFEPKTGTAWTGNLIIGAGTIPPVFEGGTREYLQTVAALGSELDIRRIIPGHGTPTGPEQIGAALAYLTDLIGTVRSSIEAGRTLEQTLAAAEAPAQVSRAQGPGRAFLAGLHTMNIATTYQDFIADKE